VLFLVPVSLPRGPFCLNNLKNANKLPVATAIALALRNPSLAHPYLHPQIFSTVMYIVAFLCIWFLRTTVLQERQAAARKSLFQSSSSSVSVPELVVEDVDKAEKKTGEDSGVEVSSDEDGERKESELGVPDAGWFAKGIL
jgi:hypothetical protein